MARRSPDEALYTAVVTQLGSATTYAAYSVVPQGTPAPYLKVTIPTAGREDTFGRLGASTLVDVDAVSAGPSQQTGVRMRNALEQALDNQRLTMSGHTMLGTAWENNEYFVEIVNGVQHHHHISSFRIWTEQSSS